MKLENFNHQNKSFTRGVRIAHWYFRSVKTHQWLSVAFLIILSIPWLVPGRGRVSALSKTAPILKAAPIIQAPPAPKWLQPVASVQPITDTATPLPQLTLDYPPVAVSANEYYAGQCVWYVKNLRPEIPGNWGNASDWLRNAQAMGWPTGSTPKVGAVAWEIGGDHVALVTAVNGDTITITEMNERFIPFEIDSRVTPANLWDYIY